jgi:hypothetical protein
MRTYLKWLFIAALVAGCSKSHNNDTYTNNPNIPDYLHNRPVGASAKEILASSTYTSLKIEIQYMTGFAPDGGAIAHLQSTLGALVNKPGGISIVTNEIPGSGNQTLSLNDIKSIEQKNRTAFTSSTELALYVLYTNGNYTEDNVLGVSYKNTSVVLLGKKIHDNSGALGQASRTKLEATVLEHEIGHLLGLVDLGSPMQTAHRDATHGNHCNNSNCLMYYSSETSDILGFLITGNIPTLDANCRADLHANGGK